MRTGAISSEKPFRLLFKPMEKNFIQLSTSDLCSAETPPASQLQLKGQIIKALFKTIGEKCTSYETLNHSCPTLFCSALLC